MSAQAMGRQASGREHPRWAVEACDRDVEMAASRHVPVLISAGPGESHEFARQLSTRCRSPRPAVRVVDCRQPNAAGAMRTLTARHRHGVPEILLLQEVYALNRDDQALLEQQLEQMLLHPEAASPVRVLASSSVRLFDRVIRQAFQERLYYLLNMIHIELPSAPPPR